MMSGCWSVKISVGIVTVGAQEIARLIFQQGTLFFTAGRTQLILNPLQGTVAVQFNQNRICPLNEFQVFAHRLCASWVLVWLFKAFSNL